MLGQRYSSKEKAYSLNLQRSNKKERVECHSPICATNEVIVRRQWNLKVIPPHWSKRLLFFCLYSSFYALHSCLQEYLHPRAVQLCRSGRVLARIFAWEPGFLFTLPCTIMGLTSMVC